MALPIMVVRIAKAYSGTVFLDLVNNGYSSTELTGFNRDTRLYHLWILSAPNSTELAFRILQYTSMESYTNTKRFT